MRQIRYEIKICLPMYKIACSICFAVLLSLVRGISSVEEIGITLNTAMAVIAAVFCADIYRSEYSGRRWEVFRLRTVRTRSAVVLVRLAVQCLYLCLVAAAGYACFFWQQPAIFTDTPGYLLFIWAMAATAAAIFFFGTLAMLLAILGKNSWSGTGAALVVWMAVNSMRGKALLGKYSVFAFSFRELSAPEDMGWLLGTGTAVLAAFAMLTVLPWIIRKRG